MDSEDFDRLESRLEKPAPRQFTRRQFMLMVGLVAGAAVAGLLGLNWLAPEMVPGLRGVKYITAKRAEEDLIDTDGDNWPNKMKSYQSGDTMFVKDTVTIIHYDDASKRYALAFKTLDERLRTPWDLPFVTHNQNAKTVKAGDLVVFASLIGRHFVGGINDQEIYGNSVWDAYDLAGKNTITRA